MAEILKIESLDLEARGIARQEGKVIFVEGALPGETVTADIVRRKPSYDMARTVNVLSASSQRVIPRCRYFGICGGCTMQHLEPAAQVAIKQRVLEDTFKHVANLRPDTLLAPLHGPSWGYRWRARLAVRLVPKKGGVLVGFHERKRSYVVDMQACWVLPQAVSLLLMPLREMIGRLSAPHRVPQIEVAVGEETVVLALRHLDTLTPHDISILQAFAQQHAVVWWLQPQGPESCHPLNPADIEALSYRLPEFGVELSYRPNDFTQVNHAVNRVLVRQALQLLAIEPHDRIADLFCGLGNFTLPIATQAREVIGIEGSSALIQRAQAAAAHNGLAQRTRFMTLNLFEVDASWFRSLGYLDRVLIDPPREGAKAVVEALALLQIEERPRRIVYVSCNPATLARDAATLVNEGGYKLMSAGIINMFAHTSHVESIAVFEQKVRRSLPVGKDVLTTQSVK